MNNKDRTDEDSVFQPGQVWSNEIQTCRINLIDNEPAIWFETKTLSTHETIRDVKSPEGLAFLLLEYGFKFQYHQSGFIHNNPEYKKTGPVIRKE